MATLTTLPPITLREIAAWDQSTGIVLAESTIKASVPALQRGLVWEPQQIELLWDSILRGFPIGALVVCPRLDSQERAKDRENGIKATHHLLDGQQRCNAIALGFTDPFRQAADPEEKTEAQSILWLDLNPNLKRDSTRNYLVRVTTMAHPWGFNMSDAANPIAIAGIRDALRNAHWLAPSEPGYRKPKPHDLWPQEAVAAVPLAWLLRLPVDTPGAFWNSLAQRLNEGCSLRWTERIRSFLSDDSIETRQSQDAIYRGIQRVFSARIIALLAPVELLEASAQEKSSTEEQVDVSNIEHLFQRLNRQGTRLDGEELAYSMIKAYWPEIADRIDEIAQWRMPQARMVAIGVRAALAEALPERLPGVVGVSALRKIARDETDDRRALIRDFIEHRFQTACTQVDAWLRYNDKIGTAANLTGLLPVHVTSIAHGSPEIYLLLLCFAVRLLKEGAPAEDLQRWCRPMQALATLGHWFAKDKGRTANRVYVNCRDGLTIGNIRQALREAIEADEMGPVHSPAAVEAFIRLPDADLEKWNWWQLIEQKGRDDDGVPVAQKIWWSFLDFRGNRELLLYAQRAFLARRFSDYDPARRDLWESHNRPWDFDHLLANKYLYYRGGRFKDVCSQWGYSIGNFRAWPFEDNRSDQAETAADKIGSVPERLDDSFLLPEEECRFSGGDQVRHDEATARRFVETCRERLLRIYRTWYESVGVSDLIDSDGEATIASATESDTVVAAASLNQTPA